MRRVLVIGLLLLVLSFIWRDVVVYGVFKYQQDYISHYECIERNKPISTCNGSCVLTERLAKPLKEVPANDSEPVLVQVKMEFYLQTTEEIVLYPLENLELTDFSTRSELEGFTSSQIKPPQSV